MDVNPINNVFNLFPDQNASLPEIVQSILNWIFGIIGIIAVIMVILGGFKLMTSTGDPGRVKKGKDTIL